MMTPDPHGIALRARLRLNPLRNASLPYGRNTHKVQAAQPDIYGSCNYSEYVAHNYL